MTNTTSNERSYISALSDDLLWRLFTLFTIGNFDNEWIWDCGVRWKNPMQQEPEDKPLITLRHVSQVCSRWREIVLSSSSLWANALDFQYLRQQENMWREEVIRRTGAALLSVIALRPLLGQPPDSDFLWDFLAQNRDRIRRLHVVVDTFHDPAEVLPVVQSISQSPKLEALCLNIHYGRPHTGFQEVLLGKSVSYLSIHRFNADLTPSSFTSLRTLKLVDCQLHPNFLVHLARMPLLEEFSFQEYYNYRFQGPVFWHPPHDSHPVNLPNLRVLSLGGTPRVTAALLAYIPPPPRLIDFSWNTLDRPVLTVDELDIFQEQFAKYFTHLMEFGEAGGISLLVDGTNFAIQTYGYDGVHKLRSRPPKIAFSFRITYPGYTLEPAISSTLGYAPSPTGGRGVISTIINFFISSPPSSFTSITSIEFSFNSLYNLPGPHLDPEIISAWLASFQAVRTLYASVLDVFLVFLLLQHRGYVLLPTMKEFIDVSKERLYIVNADAIVELTRERTRLGIPLETMDLTACNEGEIEAFMLLEDVKGLEVKLNNEVRKCISRLKLFKELPEWEPSNDIVIR
ncbi:hypothetical protein D9613_009707 [Agrocybe pediades]|uniref:F-box domain-containing protein n=1 Tax=Agrocybe pediades TaxID=84607 RepID=A0A8H4QXK0_9AGAR|nr:hypothetical protein D9613_009707 [Agrocybe pediades]